MGVCYEIKNFIKDNGLLLPKISKTIGVSNETFIAMLNGKRKITAEEYFLICHALGVSLSHFSDNHKEKI